MVYYSGFPIRQQVRAGERKYKFDHRTAKLGNDPGRLNALEKQLYVIQNAGKMSARPDEFSSENFDKLFGVINFASMSEEDQEMYESELRWILNRNSELDTALDKGREEGRAVGREEGLAKGIEQGIELGKLDASRKMKVANIADEVINQCTGLTLEQISEL